MTLVSQISALTTAIASKFNSLYPRLLPSTGTTGQVLAKSSNTDYAIGWYTLTKTSVGLGNVDNTSDASKPVSTAQQTALDLKAALAGPTFTGAPAAPTATAGTNTTQLATTAFVATAVSGKLDSSTAASTYATQSSVTSSLAAKLDSSTAASTYATQTALTAKPSKYSVSIGDGSTLAYTVTHNLGTTDVGVFLKDSTGLNIIADVMTATTNTVTVTFKTGSAPATNAVRVVVIG